MARTVFILFLKFYQKLISPFLPAHCRFHPTCSEYARQALEKYGFFKGLFYAVRRVGKCHPFHTGGFDPVP